MTMMLQSIIIIIGTSANGRDVYSVVGAGSFAINGFYFPVISAPYKYAMESDYPHGKQWFIEGWADGNGFYWTIGDGRLGSLFYAIAVPHLSHPPVQGWRHIDGFLGIDPGPVVLNVNKEGPSMLSMQFYHLRNYEFASQTLMGHANGKKKKVQASVTSEGGLNRYGFVGTEDVGFMKRNAHTMSDLPCPLPTLVWSRGLSLSCCDVYPTSFPFKQGIGEMGAPSGYFTHKPIKHGQVVYVAALDLPQFVNDVFVQLPDSHKIVLVTGQEDIGVPVELWNGSSRAANPEVWAGRAGGFEFRISYNEFINDPRLAHWFVQNLDVDGCGYYTCGEKNPQKLKQIRKKVTPIPIGLDLHTPWQTFGAVKPCHQQLIFDDIRSRLPLWSSKKTRIAVSFGTKGKGIIHDDVMLDREAAHKSFKAAGAEIVDLLPFMGRNELWLILGQYKFAAVAQGHGMDTHRLWEVLALGVVPVVLRSPLDRLLSTFPCITIDRWTDFSLQNMKRWVTHIVENFGYDPFTMNVRQRLTTGYWTGRIQAAADNL